MSATLAGSVAKAMPVRKGAMAQAITVRNMQFRSKDLPSWNRSIPCSPQNDSRIVELMQARPISDDDFMQQCRMIVDIAVEKRQDLGTVHHALFAPALCGQSVPRIIRS